MRGRENFLEFFCSKPCSTNCKLYRNSLSYYYIISGFCKRKAQFILFYDAYSCCCGTDLLPAVNGEGSNELIPSSLVERFAGPSLTPVTSFSSARGPGLRPITPTSRKSGEARGYRSKGHLLRGRLSASSLQ